jgi:diguanylate cyclase (GGDEF)-like protein
VRKGFVVDLPGYRPIEKIYSGVQHEIYRGIREADNQNVILKTPTNSHSTTSAIASLQHEFNLLKRISSPGIIQAYELLEDDFWPILVLEGVEGITLEAYLAKQALDIDVFFIISQQLISIVNALHQQKIIHKDIKPANIIINPTDLTIKLIDLSISSEFFEETKEFINLNTLQGTLHYLAPEQTGRMHRAIDRRVDFYALGVTFFKMLTGQLPFNAADPLELVHCHLAKLAPLVSEINTSVPVMLAQLINKLLAKMPEDRYACANGIMADLMECERQWRQSKYIRPFQLACNDIDEHLHISHKLYGRDDQLQQLLQAFEWISQGNRELLLIAGYSGIGKTSLIKEIYEPVTRQKGYFIQGKFDQLKRATPFSAIVEAFQGLIKQVLTEPDTKLNAYRHALQTALGNIGQVITEVIPEVEHIIGKQQDIALLNPAETQNRFKLVFQDFLQVFAQAEHPLVIFLDDLQWADSASLNLIETLLAAPQSSYLLIIGAYRDNEITDDHPLALMEQRLSQAIIPFQKVLLPPLQASHVQQLLSDTLKQISSDIAELSSLIFTKTQGNPFHINQFLQNLHQKKLLTFARDRKQWQWDIQQITAPSTITNLIDLLLVKINKLSEPAQKTLQLAACIHHTFDLHTLAVVRGQNLIITLLHLHEAVQLELVRPVDEYPYLTEHLQNNQYKQLNEKILYRFSHDRIQQAAYQLIPLQERSATHLRIGYALMQAEPLTETSEHLLEILNHFNQSIAQIHAMSERLLLARANLWAGRRAKAATAYRIAMSYFTAGIALLADELWQNNYELAFNLNKELAECTYQIGEYKQAEDYFHMLLAKAKNNFDRADVASSLIAMYSTINKFVEAVNIGINSLHELDFYIPLKPGKVRALQAIISSAWQTRKINSHNFDKDSATDQKVLLIIKLAAQLVNIAFFMDQNLLIMLAAKVTDYSLKVGYTKEIAYYYLVYAFLLIHGLKQYKQGFAFVDIGLELSKNYTDVSTVTRSNYILGAHIAHWKYPIEMCQDYLLTAYQKAQEAGDLVYGFYAITIYTTLVFTLGKPLAEAIKATEQFNAFLGKTKIGEFPDLIEFIRNFVPYLETGHYDLPSLLKKIPARDNKTEIAMLYSYFIKMAYMYNYFELAIAAGHAHEHYAEYSTGMVCHAEGKIYYALALAAGYAKAARHEQRAYLKRLKILHKQIKVWAKWCPANFAQYELLVAAERARIENNSLAAMNFYNKAIEAACENKCLHLMGTANECAARFYLTINMSLVANSFAHAAYYAFTRWGAKAKCQQLEAQYKTITTRIVASESAIMQSTSSSAKMLDMLAMVKASQAIASEIELDKLFQKLLKVIIEEAGAQQGVLLSQRAGQWIIQAEGTGESQQVYLTQPILLEDYANLPHALIRYVLHTHTILYKSQDDNLQANIPVADTYINSAKPQSWLILPILYQGELKNLIYLENRLTAYDFSNEYLQILQLLAGQAAIALANAELYYQATHDPLTGLANRYLLSLHFKQFLHDRSENRLAALLFCDLDDFKIINDTLGHDIGDKILQHFAQTLLTIFSGSCLAARLGGDEFVIVIELTKGVTALAQKIESFYQVLRKPITIEEHEIYISSSLGISFYPNDGNDLQALLNKADFALYQAKQQGKNHYRFYPHPMTSDSATPINYKKW